jgi:hypothetical protein
VGSAMIAPFLGGSTARHAERRHNMNTPFRYGWVLGLAVLGCGGTPASDDAMPSEDDRRKSASSGEQSSALVFPIFCAQNADCASSNAYCKFRDGVCEGRGICETRPRICSQIFAPVCGCDRRTYPNACLAARAGVSVSHEGACSTRPSCGGIGGQGCTDPLICVEDPGDSCNPSEGDVDCTGICICKPQSLCPPGMHWDAAPTICACVPDPNPCAVVLCPPGDHCVVRSARPNCEPVPEGP